MPTPPVPLTAVRRTAQLVRGAATRLGTRGDRGDRGQATAEYGLIILAAGGIALGVIAWASGTGSFTDMFEAVVDKLSESL
jgi:Flp pilus assembly pilin Flp